MKTYLSTLFVLLFIPLTLSSCSLTPEREVSLAELRSTRNIAYYIIEDDMDGVLKVLNRDGEVTLKSEFFKEPVYLKIFATSDGIQIRHYHRNEFSASDQ
ncbi:MAG: hypothetical protein OEV42_07245 [Deltaproteobacteria bacterium]|nr:hypothetical protein [Deltaproteobacteria bacterium]